MGLEDNDRSSQSYAGGGTSTGTGAQMAQAEDFVPTKPNVARKGNKVILGHWPDGNAPQGFTILSEGEGQNLLTNFTKPELYELCTTGVVEVNI